MKIYQQLLEKKKKMAVIGLGYVGMPIAVQFAKKIDVIGFDVNSSKVFIVVSIKFFKSYICQEN